MPNESTNESSAAVNWPAYEARPVIALRSIGPYLRSSAGAPLAIADHASVSFSPMSGRLASFGGGGGMVRVWFCRPVSREEREEASDIDSNTVGTSNTAAPTTPISSADQRLPSLTRRRRCRG